MPATVQAHWRTLGWTASSWHGITHGPDSVSKDFDQLTRRQREAAEALGYTEDKWQNDPEDPFAGLVPSSPNGAIVAMKSKTWNQLSEEQRADWERLGWTREVWDADGALPEPRTSRTAFADLHPIEQEAARELGYDEASWDADDTSWRESNGFQSDRAVVKQLAAAVATVLGLVWLDAQWKKWRANGATSGPTPTHLARQPETQRWGWRRKVAESGLTFAELPGVCWCHWLFGEILLPHAWLRRLGLEEPYWNESASYRLSDEGAWRIERAAYELHSMILEAVDEVVQSDVLLDEFGIPRELWPQVLCPQPRPNLGPNLGPISAQTSAHISAQSRRELRPRTL